MDEKTLEALVALRARYGASSVVIGTDAKLYAVVEGNRVEVPDFAFTLVDTAAIAADAIGKASAQEG